MGLWLVAFLHNGGVPTGVPMFWVTTMYAFGLLFYVYLAYLGWKSYKNKDSVHVVEWIALGAACLTLCVIIFKAAAAVHGIP